MDIPNFAYMHELKNIRLINFKCCCKNCTLDHRLQYGCLNLEFNNKPFKNRTESILQLNYIENDNIIKIIYNQQHTI